ncbi:hypothetical protein E4U60_007724 [Claviceps pazoutovae]|uniref:Uncharacterized protein n=1 Tax=Claviceps pazoutovae TaxID=1649127 RepID=A0A9P7SC24_9HYPO|nr:hypothetical protein E4U60_007724 [Claviceps pazoutovae]
MRFNRIDPTISAGLSLGLLANVTGSLTLTFRQEWDRTAATLTTPTELRGYLRRTIENAKDPAAIIGMVTSVLQEAVANISKPLSSQGASENAKSDPATHSTRTSLEVDPEFTTARSTPKSLPQMQSTISHDFVSRKQLKIKTRRVQSRILKTETHLEDFKEPLSDQGTPSSLPPPSKQTKELWGMQAMSKMPSAVAKVTTARSTPKSLPQMQSTISHDFVGRRKLKIKTRRVQSRILKTETHLEGFKEPLSDQGTPSSLPPPSKQTKELWGMQAMSKMPSAVAKVTTARSTPKSLPQMQSTISHDFVGRRKLISLRQLKIKTRRVQSRILKTETHLEGFKELLSDQGTPSSLPPPSKQTKE